MSSPGQIKYSIVIDDRSVSVSLNNLRNNLRTTFATQPGANVMNQQFNLLKTSLDQTTAKSQTFNQAVKTWDSTLKTSTTSMGALNNNFKLTQGGLTTTNTLFGTTTKSVTALGTQTVSVGSRVKDLGSRFAGFAVGLSATASSVISLQSGFRDYNDAQIQVDRTTRKLSTAHEAVGTAQDKLNALVAKGITSGTDYEKALLNLKQAEQQEAIQKKQLIEANQALGDSQTNFALSILPTVTGAIGTVGFAFKDLNLNMKSLTGLGSSIKGFAMSAATSFGALETSATGAKVSIAGLIATAAGIAIIAASIPTIQKAVANLQQVADATTPTIEKLKAARANMELLLRPFDPMDPTTWVNALGVPFAQQAIKDIDAEIVKLKNKPAEITKAFEPLNSGIPGLDVVQMQLIKFNQIDLTNNNQINKYFLGLKDTIRTFVGSVKNDSQEVNTVINEILNLLDKPLGAHPWEDVAAVTEKVNELAGLLKQSATESTMAGATAAKAWVNGSIALLQYVNNVSTVPLQIAKVIDVYDTLNKIQGNFSHEATSQNLVLDESAGRFNNLTGFIGIYRDNLISTHDALVKQAASLGVGAGEMKNFGISTKSTTGDIEGANAGITALINKYGDYTPAQKEAGLGMDRMGESAKKMHATLVDMAAGMGVSDDALLKFNVTAKTSTADVQKMNDKLLNLVLGHEQLIKVLNDTARATANANTGYIAANQKILNLIDSLEQKKAADQFELASLKLIAQHYGITLPAGIQATIENLTQLITEYKLTGSTAKATTDLINTAFAELHSRTDELIQAAVKGGKDWKQAWKDLDKSFLPKKQKDDIKDLVQHMGKLTKAIDSATTASGLLQLQLEAGDLSRKDIKEWSKQLGENLGKIEKAGKKAGTNISTLTDPLQELLKTDPSAATLEKVNLFIEHLNEAMKGGLLPSEVKTLKEEVNGLVESAKGGTEGATGVNNLTASFNKLTPAIKAAGEAWTGSGVGAISSATWSNPASMQPPTPSKTPAAQTLPAPVIPAPIQTAVNVAFNQILVNYKTLVGKIAALIPIIPAPNQSLVNIAFNAVLVNYQTLLGKITSLVPVIPKPLEDQVNIAFNEVLVNYQTLVGKITALVPALPKPLEDQVNVAFNEVLTNYITLVGKIAGLVPKLPAPDQKAVNVAFNDVLSNYKILVGKIQKLVPKLPAPDQKAVNVAFNQVLTNYKTLVSKIQGLVAKITVNNSSALSSIKAVASALSNLKDKSVTLTTNKVTHIKTVNDDSGDTVAGGDISAEDTTASFPTIRTNKVMTTNNADRNVSGGRGGTQMIELTVPVHIGDQELVRKIRKNLGNNFAKFS